MLRKVMVVLKILAGPGMPNADSILMAVTVVVDTDHWVPNQDKTIAFNAER